MFPHENNPLLKNILVRYPLKNIYFYRCQGYNATVFAYGATGGGKTYTMVGAQDSPGIMVRALHDLFAAAGENNRKVTRHRDYWRQRFIGLKDDFKLFHCVDTGQPLLTQSN